MLIAMLIFSFYLFFPICCPTYTAFCPSQHTLFALSSIRLPGLLPQEFPNQPTYQSAPHISRLAKALSADDWFPLLPLTFAADWLLINGLLFHFHQEPMVSFPNSSSGQSSILKNCGDGWWIFLEVEQF